MSRIILISDTHLCHIDWYGVGTAARLEKMTADLADEYAREPYGMILMLGDYSLDYWECGPLYGSYSNGGLSNTAVFLRDYVSRFPCPAYFIPGNHEQYTYDDWKRITGADRRLNVTLGQNVFIMLDNFGDNLNAPEHNHGTYSFAETDYIRGVIAGNPGKNVFLCAHDFAFADERDDFKSLVRDTPEILGLFAGHTHKSEILPMGAEYGGKCLYRTGNYSYSSEKNLADSMWGWRELIIDGDMVTTSYVVPESTVSIDGELATIKRHKQDEAVIPVA